MRLIDADFLKCRCANLFIEDEDFLNLIDECPTAYDIDKVVEQLIRNGRPWTPEEHYITVPNGIKIVKAGGKNDR